MKSHDSRSVAAAYSQERAGQWTGGECGDRKGQEGVAGAFVGWWIAAVFPEILDLLPLPTQTAIPPQGLTAYSTLTVTAAGYKRVKQEKTGHDCV